MATTILAIIVEAIGKIGPMVGDKVNPTGWNLVVPGMPKDIISTPQLDTVGHFSLFGSFERSASSRPSC